MEESNAPPVDADPILGHLVLALLQVAKDLLRDLGEVAAFDVASRALRQHENLEMGRAGPRTCRF